MGLCLNEQKIDSIKAIVEKKLSHHFLFRQIEFPAVDEDRILMLAMAVNRSKLPEAQTDQYVTSAMLVQAALDTHENVTNQLASMKERQLTVLAGDYFSGLYYHLLADCENLDLIRTLARAIQLINEYKVSLYQFEMDDIDTFMLYLKKVETTVIEQFCGHFKFAQYHSLFTELLFFKRLASEWEKYKRGSFSILFEGLKKYAGHDQNENGQSLEGICQMYLEKSKNVLLDTMSRLGTLPSILQSRVADLIQHNLEEGYHDAIQRRTCT